ncbi:capsular polysaccharide biosynthesis protein CapF [Parasporobacterium paucivorans]|uniref:UDP-2-acetamido-2,6-beta-L-arabino-hexul-4-ose reductase n=1 Tax=Parasporobacterium paucivorans DSM 15970 TaxID=1122934 RepID=A0A1M6GV72_9FIRM|nr:capsular polysaccharide biosynthesis protein CapF [Parasporobacterium paucivorans]SHJ13837.1 UDP-2-acetamido-2,6-beta-L-arabino-hexul-4-ose reductase [Parasporobacterium paucivorans DSM 15970]
MRILITGARGFIGKNLVTELHNRGYADIMEYDTDTDMDLLDAYSKKCEFVFHLAGVNRPVNDTEFLSGNRDLTLFLLDMLKKNGNRAPIMISSSIQAALDNPYGKSKKAAEDLLFAYAKETDIKVLVYRFPNVFGKWSRPNYNSAVATFCHNIANDLPIQLSDPDRIMSLVYIDDLVEEMIRALNGKENRQGDFCDVMIHHTATLSEIATIIQSFKENRENLHVPDMSNPLEKKLYSTYLSFLPKERFAYPLRSNADERGSFTEIIRTDDRGQFSVNIVKPGVTKGNHWHHSKNEKFLVVSGKGLVRFRKVDSDDIIEYYVSEEKMQVLDIPTGYTHSLVNVGDVDLVVFMWANEVFNPDKPDTYFLEV